MDTTSPNGITDLRTLLGSMTPEMSAASFVFVSLKHDKIPQTLQVEGMFHEKEGTTLICEEREALKYSLPYEGRYKRITLGVHSSLQAVGFLNVITSELTKAGISCNVISAYYHDHIFVLESDADRALMALKNLSANNLGEPDQ